MQIPGVDTDLDTEITHAAHAPYSIMCDGEFFMHFIFVSVAQILSY